MGLFDIGQGVDLTLSYWVDDAWRLLEIPRISNPASQHHAQPNRMV